MLSPTRNRHSVLLGISLLVWHLFVFTSARAESPTKAPTKEQQTIKVKGLKNRNMPPRLVKHDNIIVPIFPANYDWEEESRVWGVFKSILKSDSDETWESVVRQTDDEDYCLTFRWNQPHAENFTVGKLCRWHAYSRLAVASKFYRNHSKPQHDLIVLHGIKNLKTWREARPDKALWELQIELCEESKTYLINRDEEHLSKTRDFDEKTVEQWLKQIQERIDQIEEVKAPLIVKKTTEEMKSFNKKEAAKIRTQLKR